jgi:hypothetical protein
MISLEPECRIEDVWESFIANTRLTFTEVIGIWRTEFRKRKYRNNPLAQVYLDFADRKDEEHRKYMDGIIKGIIYANMHE